MLNLNPIKAEYYDYLCRRCMNMSYRVRLSEKDCVFGEATTCPSCHRYKRLVTGLRAGGHIKMLLK